MTAPFRFGSLAASVVPAFTRAAPAATTPTAAGPAAPAPPPAAAAPFALPSPFTPSAPAEPAPTPVETATPPAAAVSFSAARVSAISPALLAGLRGSLVVPPAAPEVIPPTRTFTQLAQDAVAQLRGAPRELLTEALRTLQAKGIAAATIMNLLERRTRVGEVLSGSASRWSSETVSDFAAAFQMDGARTATMDLIVALAILNEAELEGELRQENLPPTTPQDLLQNRRIVFQYPPPGTELTPPYVILVAVEHQDVGRADDAVNAILGQLVDFQGYRMPRDAAARIG